jgi:hypothetical protein
MALTKYEGAAELYVNGRLQAEAQSADVAIDANDNVVVTMQKGFAGFSDGAGSSKITVKSAIPRKGYETDFVAAVNEKKDVTIVVKSGGRRHRFEGRFQSVSWGNGTDATSMLTGEFVGGTPKTLGG